MVSNIFVDILNAAIYASWFILAWYVVANGIFVSLSPRKKNNIKNAPQGSNWVAPLINCIWIPTPQRPVNWLNADNDHDNDDVADVLFLPSFFPLCLLP